MAGKGSLCLARGRVRHTGKITPCPCRHCHLQHGICMCTFTGRAPTINEHMPDVLISDRVTTILPEDSVTPMRAAGFIPKGCWMLQTALLSWSTVKAAQRHPSLQPWYKAIQATALSHAHRYAAAHSAHYECDKLLQSEVGSPCAGESHLSFSPVGAKVAERSLAEAD